MEQSLKILSGLFALLGVFMVLMSYLLRRNVLQERREYSNVLEQDREYAKWKRRQLEIALEQMNSDDEDEVLSGLQIVTALADPAASARALPTVIELKEGGQPFIVKPAEAAYEQILHTLSESAQKMSSTRG